MITVFTPIYNRAYVIESLYLSLLRQTSHNFEWIILDDGSTDNIAELVNQWNCKLNPFPIKFIQQKNGGKHRAINRGVKEARGDAFFIVDSDDYLTNNAIQAVENWWNNIAEDDDFAGVSGVRAQNNRGASEKQTVSDKYIDATNLERMKYDLCGDKAEVYKTAILKQYPFPEFDNENFITEAVVWDKIAKDGYKIRWYNQVIYICEYKEDGLTRNIEKKLSENPKGWGLYISQSRLFGKNNREQDYFAKLNYYGWLHMKLTDEEIMSNLNISITELEQIKNYIKNTIDYIGKNIAVYGLGKRGETLLRLYQGTQVTVKYVLDINKRIQDYIQLDIDEKLPDVDAIIVTPKLQQNEIIEKLKKKTSNLLLGYEEWEAAVLRP